MYFDIHLPSSAAQPQTARLYVDNTAENTAHPGPAQHPTVLAIHGVLCDHSVWQPLAPGLHALGWNMAALDLPGHGRSSGPAPKNVPEAAAWIAALVQAMQLPRVILMGHSWGSLIALAAAAQLGERISHLVLIGTASPMTVAPALLDLAQNDPAQAIALIDKYSRSPVTPADFDGQALGHAVLASNPATNLLHCGLTACNSYHEAPVAMQQVTAPTLFMTGEYDRMTPAAAAQPLIAAAQSRTPRQGNAPATHVVTLACGHQHMLDATPAMVQALADFVRS